MCQNQKSKCDKKLKILQNSKTQNVTRLKNWNCDNLKCDKTQELKMLQNSKTQNFTKLKK